MSSDLKNIPVDVAKILESQTKPMAKPVSLITTCNESADLTGLIRSNSPHNSLIGKENFSKKNHSKKSPV